MKKRYNLIGLLALAFTVGITTSCSDFLTQENKKALTEEQIYSEVEFIELNLKGIYKRQYLTSNPYIHLHPFLNAKYQLRSIIR